MASVTLTKILVLRLSSIGDVILTSPFLRVFKKAHPGAEIHFAVRREFADLLRHHPAIDRLICIDTAEGRNALRGLNLMLVRERYDAVFDLHNNFRTRILRNGLSRRIHRISKRQWRRLLLLSFRMNTYPAVVPVPERYIETAAPYGVVPDARGAELYVPEDVRGGARLKMRAAGWDCEAPLVGICPGAKHFTKRWPEERFRDVALALLDEGVEIAVFGAEEDAATGEALKSMDPRRVHNCCGRLSLLETAAAMSMCRSVIANDSGLMHMATAMGRPVVAIFGSTVREFGFFPYHQRSAVVEANGLSCRPCTHIGRAACPKGHFACMLRIPATAVLDAYRQLESPDGLPGE